MKRASNPFRRHVLAWVLQHAAFLARVDRRRLRIVRYPAPAAVMEAAVAAILDPTAATDPIARTAFQRAWHARSATDNPKRGQSAVVRWLKGGSVSKDDRRWADDAVDAFGLRWLVGPPAFEGTGRALPFRGGWRVSSLDGGRIATPNEYPSKA